MNTSQYPLSNLLVLEAGDTIACAYAGKMLCDAGARVVRLESASGGELRRWKASAELGLSEPLGPDEDGALFQYLNTSKHSVVIDGDQPIDAEQVQRLLSRADVLLVDDRAGLFSRAASATAEGLALGDAA